MRRRNGERAARLTGATWVGAESGNRSPIARNGVSDMSRTRFETSFYVGQLLRVLQVEDNASDAELILQALRKAGYQVRADTVMTADEFAAKLAKGAYDLVLCDGHLPGWTGMEALELLQQLQQEIPFILVTGALEDEQAAAFIDKGADDYILKDRLARLPLAVRRVRRERRLLEERKKAAEERERLITQLQNTLAEVRRLNGLLPICVTCKRVLSVQGYWSRIEMFIERYSDAKVSPSLCPSCASRLYPECYN
jgi:CheY-like chemotaxis protein